MDENSGVDGRKNIIDNNAAAAIIEIRQKNFFFTKPPISNH